MAKLRFEIDGDPSRVAFESFLLATWDFLGLLREIDQVISGRYLGSLRWYVSGLHSNGALTVEVLSRVKPAPKRARPRTALPPDFSGRVADSLVTGFENVQTFGTSPPYLSLYGLQRLDSMLGVLQRNGARGYRTTDIEQGRVVELQADAIDNVRALIPTKRTTIGSVEGKLEAISIHNKKRFIVYDALTKKAINCNFTDDLLTSVKDSLGQRVLVSGMLHWNAKSEAKSVDAENVRVLGAERLPTTEELSGEYPEITDGMTTEAYIRSIRGE